MAASRQTVTDGNDKKPSSDNNVTHFNADQDTGQLALYTNGSFVHLGRYNGERARRYTVRVNETQSELHFYVNHSNKKPRQGSMYVGIEIIRLYAFRSIADSVLLWRNEDWVDPEGGLLPSVELSAPGLSTFVQDHHKSHIEDYLAKWHARPSKNAESSWGRRNAISNGLGVKKNREGYVQQGRYEAAQGTYRLIRFRESPAPSKAKSVDFTVKHNGAKFLLVNVFQPDGTGEDYQGQYVLQIIQ